MVEFTVYLHEKSVNYGTVYILVAPVKALTWERRTKLERIRTTPSTAPSRVHVHLTSTTTHSDSAFESFRASFPEMSTTSTNLEVLREVVREGQVCLRIPPPWI